MVQCANGPFQIREGPGIGQNVVGSRQARFPRGLCIEDPFGPLGCLPVTFKQSAELSLAGTIDNEDPIYRNPSALDQQGDGEYAVVGLERGHTVVEKSVNPRVDNRFKRPARLGVRENDLPQLPPVQCPVRQQHARPKTVDHGLQPGRTGCHCFAGEPVGVDDRHSEALESRADGGFSAGDSARQTDPVHHGSGTERPPAGHQCLRKYQHEPACGCQEGPVGQRLPTAVKAQHDQRDADHRAGQC